LKDRQYNDKNKMANWPTTFLRTQGNTIQHVSSTSSRYLDCDEPDSRNSSLIHTFSIKRKERIRCSRE
jgi:hypothetical protein